MIKDLSGKTFGKITVLSFNGIKNSKYYWNCKCECGTEKAMRSDHIKIAKSCGCLTKFKSKHNLSKSSFHTIWRGMISRCIDEREKSYKYYGGRGIKVCDEWFKFENFIEDMLPTYKEGLTIDRKDNNEGYNKENCRWVTSEFQNKNKRNSVYVVYQGKKYFLKDLCKELGADYQLSYRRYKRGWEVDRIFSEAANEKYWRKNK